MRSIADPRAVVIAPMDAGLSGTIRRKALLQPGGTRLLGLRPRLMDQIAIDF
jgi:hypothetical protein